MSQQAHIQQLLAEAWSERRVGNYEESRKLVSKARELCKEDDYNSLGRIFHIYMQFEYDHEKHAKALEFCQQSLEYYRKTKNANKIAHSTRHIADLQRHLGHRNDSELNYQKAIDIYRTSSDVSKLDLANALRGYGLLLENLGKIDDAIGVWEDVKELYSTCDIQAGVDEARDRLDSLGA